MLKSTVVFVTVVIVAGLVALGLIGVVGFLAYEGRAATDLLTLVNVLISGTAVAKTYQVKAQIEKIDAQTNGTNQRLMDHALGKAE